jgi:hypothetical protein
MSYSPIESSVAAQVRPGDRWISRIAAATVAGLAGAAGALSYSHMRQLAQDHGQAGWHAHAFPLSVDGVEIVASLVLLADRQAGRRSGWLPWAALAAGTAGSLAANIATAHPDPVSRLIAGWPALALLIAVKLLSGILHRQSSADQLGVPGPESTQQEASNGKSRNPDPSAPASPVSEIASDIAFLLPAARAARTELHLNGQSLTRDALAARLRQHGHPIRNDRITPLLRQLRQEEPPPSPQEPANSARCAA